MAKLTIEAIDQELARLLEKGTLSAGTLVEFNALSEARKHLSKMPCKFSEEDAKEWIAAMDPPARWTMDQTTTVMASKGYSHRPCEFWVVMNMLYSDYGKTMAKYGADKPEVWADMTDAFLNDPDAVPHKVGRYYRDIVEH